MNRAVSLGAQGIAIVAALVAIALAAAYVELFTLVQLTLFAAMAVLSLSLAFIWGFGGILSFGQTAFFGLGGYAYAIAVINLGDSTPAILIAIAVAAAFAAILGFFIFYGGVSDVYLGVITLTIALILFNVMNSTSGEEYTIGVARLGGFNGIPSVPTFNAPFDPSAILSPEASWWVTATSLLGIYLFQRLLLRTRFGRVVVAVRENETRAALLGYDIRLVKLCVFVIGGAIAGYAGTLYVNWGAFISPTIFSLSLSAEIIIWIMVGGLGTLIGPIIGCFIIQYIGSLVGTQQTFNSNLVLGAILVAFVLVLPRGVVPTLQQAARYGARIFNTRTPKAKAPAAEGQPASGGVR